MFTIVNFQMHIECSWRSVPFSLNAFSIFKIARLFSNKGKIHEYIHSVNWIQFLSRALCSRGVFSQISAFRTANQFPGVRCITMKIVQKPVEPDETPDERNMRLNRELSPHLSIYKPQLTTVLSISHRITGIIASNIIEHCSGRHLSLFQVWCWLDTSQFSDWVL